MTRRHKRFVFAYFAVVSSLFGSGYVFHGGSPWWGLLFIFSLRCTIGAIRGK